MLEHTKEALNNVRRIWSVGKWVFEYGMNILMVIYLSLAIAFSLGNVIVNSILLGITTLILIATIIFSRIELNKKRRTITIKRIRKTTKHALKVGKILVKAYSLGVTLYGMFIAASMVSPINIIVTTLLIIMWVMTVIMEVSGMLIDLLGDYLVSSIKEDFKWALSAKSTIETKLSEGKEYVQEKYEMGKEFAQEKYEQGKEYAQGVVEQGKTKLDEAKTAVQDFFKKNKKAE